MVTRSKRILDNPSRYRPAVLTGTFPDVLDRMAAPEMAFLEQRIGSKLAYVRSASETAVKTGSRMTTVKAGWRLVTRIEEHGLTFEDFDVSDAEEVILLKDEKAHYLADKADLKEYEDTQVTERYRSEVLTINARLKDADISFEREAAREGVVDTDTLRIIEHADPTARQLRRYFSRGSFESGGRLFGGFWQGLPKDVRLRGIRIDGAPVVSLDYGHMNPLLAYSVVRKEPLLVRLHTARSGRTSRWREDDLQRDAVCNETADAVPRRHASELPA